MFYTQELMNLKNPEEYRTALHIMFHSLLEPKDLFITYKYYKEFGPEEKLKETEEMLDRVYSMLDSYKKSLEERLRGLSFEGKIVDMVPNFYDLGVEAERNKEGKLEFKYIQKM